MGRDESCGIREFFVISIGWSENELGHADRVTLSVRVCVTQVEPVHADSVTLSVRVCVMQVELPKMSIFCLFGPAFPWIIYHKM